MNKSVVTLMSIVYTGLCANAQYNVGFAISQLPSYHSHTAKVYIAGSFNSWNPGDEKYRLQQQADGTYRITVPLPKGLVEYKFTRGSWESAECAAGGLPSENHHMQVERDTAVRVTIEHWADHFPPKKRSGTATENVHIVDTAFFMPQLNRHRRIWIYLPAGYETTQKSYPVLYMHDGQNVFDDATSFAGEWGVDETLDTLGLHHKEAIVVAVDNGGTKRMNEYSPYNMAKYGKGEGDQYVDFLVQTLKPYIDQHYRTHKRREDTFIAGSSMGGLISFYAMLKYPDTFGGAGVFSPSFWVAPAALKQDIAKRGSKVKGKVYFYMGKQEGSAMVEGMLTVFDQLRRLSKATMTTVIRTEGKHNEATWRKEFPLFYKWIMQ